jgi:hypothetical protein
METGGKVLDKGVVELSDLPTLLATLSGYPVFTIVCEGFRLFRRLADRQSGSTIPAAQGIGIVKGYCAIEKVHYVEQQPDARLMGAKYAQYVVRKGHMADDISAWLHGVFYLKQIGQLETVLERKLQSDSND